MPSDAKKPTVIVLDRPRRIVVREEPQDVKTVAPRLDKAAGEARRKVLNRLRRLHPMD